MYHRHSYPVVVKDVDSESDIEIFQMYGIDGVGPAPSLYTVLGDKIPVEQGYPIEYKNYRRRNGASPRSAWPNESSNFFSGDPSRFRKF